MLVGLGRVRVEVIEADVEDARPQAGVDQLSCQLQTIGQARLRIDRLRLIVLRDVLETPARLVSVRGGALHERERAGFACAWVGAALDSLGPSPSLAGRCVTAG